jgi:hypothetical protein
VAGSRRFQPHLRTERSFCKTFQARKRLCFDASNSSSKSWIALGVVDMGAVFKITPQLSRPQTRRLKDLRSPMGIAKYWFRPSDSSLSIILLRRDILHQRSYSQLSTERSKTDPHNQNVSSYFDLRRRNETRKHRMQLAELLTRYSQAVRRTESRSVCFETASLTGNYSLGATAITFIWWRCRLIWFLRKRGRFNLIWMRQ